MECRGLTQLSFSLPAFSLPAFSLPAFSLPGCSWKPVVLGRERKAVSSHHRLTFSL